MSETKLLHGLFQTSQEKGKEYLLYLDVDRLIAPCYIAAGKEPKKERYGGWESTPIAGHSIGHWLSAAATMYAVTKDVELKEKLNYALDELQYVQSLDKDGYISGFSRECFDKVFTGEFEVENFSLAGSWVPWYSIHKIYAGLIDVYRLLEDERALTIVKKMADWAYEGLSNLTYDAFQKMLTCEHGGMNEVFADLYLITNDNRYLELAEKFYHEAILEPLAIGEDDLEGKHANTQIPKVIGCAKLYTITGKEKYKHIATFFWNQVVKYRTYAIGGNSIREHFGQENEEELGVLTTETCNTYNMLKLTEIIFRWDPNSIYYDFYEKALYNHILASQDPDSGMKTYFVSSEPGHFKVYNSKDNSFWCCTGTGMENPARYNRSIFEEMDDRFYVHLFIAAAYKSNDTALKQETLFPYRNETVLTIDKIPASKAIYIRNPYWQKGALTIRINGEIVDAEEENGYVKLTNGFQKGDVVSIRFTIGLHLYQAKDDVKKQVVMYGPLVLAGALGRENFPETDILDDHQELNNHPLIEVPTIVTNESDVNNWVALIDEENLIFETSAIGQPGNQKVTLKPFYAVHHERYTIYFNVMKEENYHHFVDKEKELRDRLQRITVDVVTPHEQQPEVDHQMKTSKSTSGYFNVVHRGYRDARDGGFFSYEIAVKSSEQMYLAVTYFGGDIPMHIDGKRMERDFDIFVNDQLLAHQLLDNHKPGKLFTNVHLIPMEWYDKQSYVTVRFQAQEGTIAGGVYEVRMINENQI